MSRQNHRERLWTTPQVLALTAERRTPESTTGHPRATSREKAATFVRPLLFQMTLKSINDFPVTVSHLAAEYGHDNFRIHDFLIGNSQQVLREYCDISELAGRQ